MAEILVIIPTYNEIESLANQVIEVRHHTPEVDILIVDDNSPDGTGELADELAIVDPKIHVLHRAGKEGLGQAYLAGFEWGLDRGYEFLCEMDADGSHRASDLPRLLRRAQRPDQPALVIGSRWVPGGSVVNWPWHRKLLSVGGNDYVGAMLGWNVKDSTAGFRVYRADFLREVHLDEVESHGYCFQVDMTWRTIKSGAQVVEVPIKFVERTAGDSKMSRGIVSEALVKTTVWGLKHRANQLRALAR
ncbi:MAG: polyprenol monophosphomannose synthase [Promicromonosporaceae bacterium]|nr:polyprenol monophosphomannose synthase [Promicromonosporaceae bacterium]